MKYASQINIVIMVVALVTVGYAVSQTLWRSPVNPSVEVRGGGPAGVSSTEGSKTPTSSEAELSGRENLRRQIQQPRPAAAFQPNREPGGGSTRADRQPTTTSPRRRPAGLYPHNSAPQAQERECSQPVPGFHRKAEIRFRTAPALRVRMNLSTAPLRAAEAAPPGLREGWGPDPAAGHFRRAGPIVPPVEPGETPSRLHLPPGHLTGKIVVCSRPPGTPC